MIIGRGTQVGGRTLSQASDCRVNGICGQLLNDLNAGLVWIERWQESGRTPRMITYRSNSGILRIPKLFLVGHNEW